MSSQPDAAERLSEARILFGYTLSKDPYTVYEAADTPLPDKLGKEVTHHVAAQFAKDHDRLIGADIKSLLGTGIHDTQTLLHDHLVSISLKFGPEAARRFGSHERTIQTIARLALRAETPMKMLIADHREGRPSSVYIFDDGEALDMLPPSLPPESEDKCPLAHTGDGVDISPDPLFRRFVAWTTSLCVASIEEHVLQK